MITKLELRSNDPNERLRDYRDCGKGIEPQIFNVLICVRTRERAY